MIIIIIQDNPVLSKLFRFLEPQWLMGLLYPAVEVLYYFLLLSLCAD